MFQSSMPKRYWLEAFSTAVYLINRLPTPVLNGRSPYEVLFRTRPDYSLLRVFGCACYPVYTRTRNFFLSSVFFWATVAYIRATDASIHFIPLSFRSSHRSPVHLSTFFDDHCFPFAVSSSPPPPASPSPTRPSEVHLPISPLQPAASSTTVPSHDAPSATSPLLIQSSSTAEADAAPTPTAPSPTVPPSSSTSTYESVPSCCRLISLKLHPSSHLNHHCVISKWDE